MNNERLVAAWVEKRKVVGASSGRKQSSLGPIIYRHKHYKRQPIRDLALTWACLATRVKAC